MNKLLFAILLVNPCLGGEPAIPRAALQQVQVIMLARIAVAQAHEAPEVLLEYPKAKNVQHKKYAREQKNQKFPQQKLAKGKKPRR